MTLVERLCRCLCQKTGTRPDAMVIPYRLPVGPKPLMTVVEGSRQQPAWTVYIGEVLDMLREAREPTPSMAMAHPTHPCRDIWALMIDAAVAEWEAAPSPYQSL